MKQGKLMFLATLYDATAASELYNELDKLFSAERVQRRTDSDKESFLLKNVTVDKLKKIHYLSPIEWIFTEENDGIKVASTKTEFVVQTE